MEIGKTPSGADGILHHAPKAFNGVEVVPTMGAENETCKIPDEERHAVLLQGS
jgi:hypothetical protein